MPRLGWTRLATETWMLEILSIISSIIAIVAIAVLLGVFNGKANFHWHHVTLNAVVAVCATICRGGLLFAVCSALGQWKWEWYSSGPKALKTFASIDGASRDSLGGLDLIWRTRSISIVSIGAWVVVLAIVIDPFAQQLLSFNPGLTYQSDNSTQIPIARRWSQGIETVEEATSHGQVGGVSVWPGVTPVADVSTQSAVLYGFTSDSNKISQQLPVQCDSGNCTWSDYVSLAMCSTCVDISHLVKKHALDSTENAPISPMVIDWPNANFGGEYGDVTRFTLPNGLYIDNFREAVPGSWWIPLTASGTNRPSNTMAFQDSDTMVFSISTMKPKSLAQVAKDKWGNAEIEALECSLNFCVSMFNSSVKSGSLVENSIKLSSTRASDSWKVLPSPGNAGPVDQRFDALFEPDFWAARSDLAINISDDVLITHTPDQANATFRQVKIGQPAVDSLSVYLSSFWSASPVRGLNSTGAIMLSGGTVSVTDPLTQSIWNTGAELLFEQVAMSITNNMRAYADNNTQVSGSQGQVVTLIQTRIYWLIVPAACVLLGTIFLLATIFRTLRSDVPLWKNDAAVMLMTRMEGHVQPDNEIEGVQRAVSFHRLVLPKRDAVEDSLNGHARLRTGLDISRKTVGSGLGPIRSSSSDNSHLPFVGAFRGGNNKSGVRATSAYQPLDDLNSASVDSSRNAAPEYGNPGLGNVGPDQGYEMSWRQT